MQRKYPLVTVGHPEMLLANIEAGCPPIPRALFCAQTYTVAASTTAAAIAKIERFLVIMNPDPLFQKISHELARQSCGKKLIQLSNRSRRSCLSQRANISLRTHFRGKGANRTESTET
jgi:hypothetical protein